MTNIRKTWFESWGEEKAQNAVLKGLLVVFTMLLATQTIALLILAKRDPLFIGLSTAGSKLLTTETPKPAYLATETERTLRAFAEESYNWNHETVSAVLEQASRLVGQDFRAAYLLEAKPQIEFAKQKNITQKFFISSYEPLEGNKALITGDRIIVMDGIRATSPLKLELSYVLGNRTKTNPEGVYVTAKRIVEDSPTKAGGANEQH